MTSENDDAHISWGLQFPFTCTTSRGGPYDDASFVAGYQMGMFATQIQMASSLPIDKLNLVIYKELWDQLDLIAMQNHWHISLTKVWDDTWTLVTLERTMESEPGDGDGLEQG